MNYILGLLILYVFLFGVKVETPNFQVYINGVFYVYNLESCSYEKRYSKPKEKADANN